MKKTRLHFIFHARGQHLYNVDQIPNYHAWKSKSHYAWWNTIWTV